MDIDEYSLYEARQQKRRYQLLYEIWLKGPVSRAQLAQDLHLHPPTISTLITDLIAEKAVVEHGRAASTGGRKPQLLDVNPDSGSVIGITFTTRGITSAWADLRGNLFDLHNETYDPASGTDKTVQQIVSAVERQAANQAKARPGVPIVCIGGGTSGLVNPEGTIMEFPRFPDWKDVPLRKILEKHFAVPAHMDSHLAAIMLTESLFGNHKGFKNAMFVQLGPGLGLGLFIEGKIYRGSNFRVGEFGHVTAVDEGGAPCYCGNTGCLEGLASDYALAEQAAEAIESGTRTRIPQFVDKGEPITSAAIFKAAKAGDKLALKLVDKAARRLGTGIAGLINLFGPELILLGGTLSETGGELLFDPIAETVRKRALDRMVEDVQIKPGSFGKVEAIRGAVTLALYFYYTRRLNSEIAPA